MQLFILFGIYFFILQPTFALNGSSGAVKGVDFRMQLVNGNLDFTSVSGVKRQFKGIGSELQTSLYILELGRFRISTFLSSRVMNWVGQNVRDSEYDDLQTFSVAPGLEMQLGPLFIQGSSQRMNANAYNISSTSIGNQFVIEGPCLAAGFNFKFNHLGLGFGVTKMNFPVPADIIGLTSASQYTEQSYSFNFVYNIGDTPGKFFYNLFYP